MRAFLLAFGLLISLAFALPLTAQEAFNPQPEAYFFNPAVYIEDLPRLLLAPPVSSSLGDIRADYLASLGRLFIQVAENDFQYFNVPAEWGFHTDGGIEIIPLNADGLTLYCSYPASAQAPLTVEGVGVTLDAATGNVNQVGCIVTPDQNGYSHSEPSTSPDGRYILSIVPTRDLTAEECPPDEYIGLLGYPARILINGSPIGCISLDGIEVRAWIDNTHALLRTYDPKTTTPLIERWYDVDAEQGRLIPLGMTMEIPATPVYASNDSTFLLAANTSAARWMIQSVSDTIPGAGGRLLPETCALELLDLTRLDGVSFNTTPSSCLFYPQITVAPAGDRLLYVRSVPPADAARFDQPTMTAMLVDPIARTEQALNLTGITVHIVSISPDGQRALFIVDQGQGARHNPFEDGIAYVQPTWVVYDLAADAPLYTAPAITSTYYGHIYDSTYGLQAFTWTDDGWSAIFNPAVFRLPLTLMRWSAGSLTEIPLDAIPRSNQYYIVGSPDGRYATLATDFDALTYLINMQDGRIAEFERPPSEQPASPPYFATKWRADGRLEAIFTAPDDLLMLRRWLINPARAFEE